MLLRRYPRLQEQFCSLHLIYSNPKPRITGIHACSRDVHNDAAIVPVIEVEAVSFLEEVALLVEAVIWAAS